jgi:hypothetical protein
MPRCTVTKAVVKVHRTDWYTVKGVSKAQPSSVVSVNLTLRNNPEDLHLEGDKKVSVHLKITIYDFLASLLGSI